MTESHRYNIILLGEVGVGKTSLFNRIKTGRFHENQSTLGEECYEKSMMVEGDEIRVSFCHRTPILLTNLKQAMTGL